MICSFWHTVRNKSKRNSRPKRGCSNCTDSTHRLSDWSVVMKEETRKIGGKRHQNKAAGI